ncbi:MAG: glycosyltransferase family 2 protein [Bacteroidaceae bacterium]|nr:glycosyltransferase family 2 protein [Bacteroidaceae bacterium]
MNKKVSILIPCFNEEEGLPMLYDALCGDSGICNILTNYNFEVLLINDGSRDNTLEAIKHYANQDSRIKYISLSRNFGKECAMLSGFDYTSGDCMVIMDADLQHPPTLIPEMLMYWEQGFQDVYAKRKSRGKESWLRKQFSLTYYHLLQRTSRFDILENVGDFRLLDKVCIDALRQLREKERYTKGMFAWIGFKKKEILFEQGDRQTGVSSWRFKDLLNLGIDGITSFTTAPLRFSTIVGFFISLFAFIYMCWVLLKAIVWGDPVAGFPSLMVVILFLGGVQLLSLGIIGEYLGRVFNETKSRPVYLVSETNVEK